MNNVPPNDFMESAHRSEFNHFECACYSNRNQSLLFLFALDLRPRVKELVLDIDQSIQNDKQKDGHTPVAWPS